MSDWVDHSCSHPSTQHHPRLYMTSDVDVDDNNDDADDDGDDNQAQPIQLKPYNSKATHSQLEIQLDSSDLGGHRLPGHHHNGDGFDDNSVNNEDINLQDSKTRRRVVWRFR